MTGYKKIHAQLSSVARGLNASLSLCLRFFFKRLSSVRSDKTSCLLKVALSLHSPTCVACTKISNIAFLVVMLLVQHQENHVFDRDMGESSKFQKTQLFLW